MEMYINGEWGTVCGISWDPLDGKVVCRQLGYKGVNRTYSHTGQHNFGEGTGPSWLRGPLCTGSEANLLQCPHDGVGDGCRCAGWKCLYLLLVHDGVLNGCAHSHDVGVVCTNASLPDEGE